MPLMPGVGKAGAIKAESQDTDLQDVNRFLLVGWERWY